MTTSVERTPPGANPGADPTSTALGRYESMVRIRRFEEYARRLFLQGAEGLRGALHDGIGQEAVTAGVIAALRSDDQVLSSHRCHGQVIAKGAPLDAVFAEILGRSTGLCGGKGGSMHLTSVRHGHYGCSGIVGGQLPLATGMALSARMRGADTVVACFFGDGATNIGAFHEAVNLAALWRLPVLFVCENNHYTEQMRSADITPVVNPAADRAASYGLAQHIVDGNDVEAVYAHASSYVAELRVGGGPVLLEATTYRINGHSLFDGAKYRDKSEVEQWRTRDPLVAQRRRLEERGVVAGALDKLEQWVDAEIKNALARAKEQPHTQPDALLTGLWADGGAAWRS